MIAADVVAEDELGHWFYAPAGVGNQHSLDGLLLLPHHAWWVAWWWRDEDPLCTVDVVTPARWESSCRWIYDDLEIDLAMRESGGIVSVVDVDEFAAAVSTVPYPPDLIVGAIMGMRDAEGRMSAKAPPFDTGFDRLRSFRQPA